MYKRLLIFALCIISLTALIGLLPVHGETDIYENVLRLHVLANSDSTEDQELKLKVRDAVLEYTEEIFESCHSKEQAQGILAENLDNVRAVAKEVLKEEGCELDVSVELGREEYPTRNYESCCFPAGEYTSLRVMIGSAEGQNWWCVLFPPLCLSAAGDSSEAFAQVGLTDRQYGVITQSENPKYKVRFKILEALGALNNN